MSQVKKKKAQLSIQFGITDRVHTVVECGRGVYAEL